MPRAEDENVIQTFTPQRSDQPFGICRDARSATVPADAHLISTTVDPMGDLAGSCRQQHPPLHNYPRHPRMIGLFPAFPAWLG
ncbi:MAG: hypothetical protein WAK69_04790 [Rhodoplanes sp.]